LDFKHRTSQYFQPFLAQIAASEATCQTWQAKEKPEPSNTTRMAALAGPGILKYYFHAIECQAGRFFLPTSAAILKNTFRRVGLFARLIHNLETGGVG
jgi:hypothetical protein